MATWTAEMGLEFFTSGRRRTPRRAVSRRRWNLAGTIEILLDPSLAPGPRLNFWPRIPKANRAALAEPMAEIVSLLRNPEHEIPERALERVFTLVTHPGSPAYGSYPNQARFAAYSLVEQLGATAVAQPA
jgi:hypothetical protein